jgi:hypothetical protein
MDRGYVVVFEPMHPNARKDGYVAEDIKVMAAQLGRPLQQLEEVHHNSIEVVMLRWIQAKSFVIAAIGGP